MYKPMVYNAIVQEICTFAAMGATGPKLKFRSQASVPATGGPEFNSVNICHVQDEADLRLLSTVAGGRRGAVRRGGATSPTWRPLGAKGDVLHFCAP